MYGIRNLLRYGIATKERMESSRSDAWNQSEGERALIRASRDAMRDFVAIPYYARGALMPYQSFGLDKKIPRNKSEEFFWLGCRDSEPIRKSASGFGVEFRIDQTSQTKNKREERCSSLLFLAGVQGFEPRKCQSQSLMPYRLATPQYLFFLTTHTLYQMFLGLSRGF